MKTCSVCKQPQLLVAFNKNKSKKDGLSSHCRECSHRLFKKYYSLNREKHRREVTTNNRKIRRENHRRMYDFLLTRSCVDCGEKDPIVLDFDHVRGEKIDEVTGMVNSGCSWKTIEIEIMKCDVRCANCHRRKTAKERNLFRWRYKNE